MPDKTDVEKAAEALAIDREPVFGDDLRLRVSKDISDQAVEHGFAPDVQPKHQAPAPQLLTGVQAAGTPPNAYPQRDLEPPAAPQKSEGKANG